MRFVKVNKSNKIKKNIALLFLVLMCTQYIPLEGYGVSIIKLTALCLAPIIWLISLKTFSRAFVLGVIYILAILFSANYNVDSFRLSTLVYKMSFIIMFIMYYDLIYHNRALTLQEFIKFLKVLILAFFICLVLQQIAILLGFSTLQIINLTYFLDRGIGSNSLTLEPSHAARILTVLMLVMLRMYEVKWGSIFRLSRFYKENKWIILAFLWCILSIGSATAFVGLLILSFYFIKKKYLLGLSLLLVVFYLTIPYINYGPFTRAKSSIEATLTLDQEKIIEADVSGAVRIVPFINTITLLETNKMETWLGKGVDANKSEDYLSLEQTIGGISDYGLICFILSLIFVFACCIRKFWSLETLIFLVLMGLTIGNIAYVWGILMLLATSKHFTNNKRFYHQSLNSNAKMI